MALNWIGNGSAVTSYPLRNIVLRKEMWLYTSLKVLQDLITSLYLIMYRLRACGVLERVSSIDRTAVARLGAKVAGSQMSCHRYLLYVFEYLIPFPYFYIDIIMFVFVIACQPQKNLIRAVR